MGKLSLGTVSFAAFVALAHAQSQQELLRDGNGGSTDNVLTYGMGYHQQRYSPLKQISKSTVKRLVPVWSASLANEFGEQGQPLVYNGVLYTANVKRVVAIDVATGRRSHAWCAAGSPTEGWRSTTASCSSARSTHT
jgi:alcohol dehydrogenase (cytochrome c)